MRNNSGSIIFQTKRPIIRSFSLQRAFRIEPDMAAGGTRQRSEILLHLFANDDFELPDHAQVIGECAAGFVSNPRFEIVDPGQKIRLREDAVAVPFSLDGFDRQTTFERIREKNPFVVRIEDGQPNVRRGDTFGTLVTQPDRERGAEWNDVNACALS